MDKSEELATSILRSVRFKRTAQRSAEIIRRMTLGGEDHDISMFIVIGGRSAHFRPIGSLGDKFRTLLEQVLKTWQISLEEFIGCGLGMTVKESREISAMHVIIKLRQLDGDATFMDRPVESQPPRLVLIRGGS